MAPSTLTVPSAVYIITGCVAALSCYAIYQSYHTAATPTSPTLHRSNAVHRRRTRRPRSGQAEENDIIIFDVPSGTDPDGVEDYETMLAEDGRSIRLLFAAIIDLTALRDAVQRPQISEEDLPSYQSNWAFDWLRTNYPGGAARSTILSDLIRLGFTPPVIELTAERHAQACRNGGFGAAAQVHYREHGTHEPSGEVIPAGNDDAQTVAATDLTDRPAGALHGSGEGQNLKQLLYFIAEHQSREDGYVHRGVRCNQCDVKPIRGTRWRCTNCADYDLCSECEAQSMHDKTHIFAQVKIPCPFLTYPEPVVYPGKPQIMRASLPNEFRIRMVKETDFELHEVDALYDQFSCLADERWPGDPNGIGAAINRRVFAKTFTPLASSNVPAPNIIYDRMFAFYDTDHNGRIGFEEFIKGLALFNGKVDEATKMHRVFEGYDIDNDGFVSRKDFLRMFRGYYSIQKEITRDLLAAQQVEESLAVDERMELINSGLPLSSAFSSAIPHGERGAPQNKPADAFGDRRRARPPTQPTVEDQVCRHEIIGNAWEFASGFPVYQKTGTPLSRSGTTVTVQDADGTNVTREVEFTYGGKLIDDARAEAVKDRWRRRQFYTDEEEGMEPPPGVDDGKQSADALYPAEGSVHTNGEPSHTDPAISDILHAEQSRSIPTSAQAAAWHSSHAQIEVQDGYRIPQAERDLGKDILYQVTIQGINELLDPMFKEKEDLAMAVYETREERRKWREEIKHFKARREEEKKRTAVEANEPSAANGATSQDAESVTELTKDPDMAIGDIENKVQEQSLDELLAESGYGLIDDEALNERLQRSLSPSPGPSEDARPANGHARGPNDGTTAKDAPDDNQDSGLGLETEDKENIDPTLPHMRPSTPTERARVPLEPTGAQAEHLSQEEQAEVGAVIGQALREELKARFAFMVLGREPRLDFENGTWNSINGKITLDVPAPKSNVPRASADHPPSDERLEYLVGVDEVERDIGARGGPGRLSFQEFEAFMKSDAGHKMGFVDAWLELGSF